jgi:hypothetical protein
MDMFPGPFLCRAQEPPTIPRFTNAYPIQCLCSGSVGCGRPWFQAAGVFPFRKGANDFPPIRCCGARLAFVPEGTQNVSVATAIGMKATNGLVHSFRLSPD